MSDRPTFEGSAEQQQLAAQIFSVMSAQGRFYAADAPIRQTLNNLAGYFATQHKADATAVAGEIDAAMRKNAAVFQREEAENEVFYITSRIGAPIERVVDTMHMFKQRLHDPEHPLPVDDISVVVTTTRPALTTIEPVYISNYWQQQAGIIPADAPELDEEIAADADMQLQPELEVAAPVAATPAAPVVPTPAPSVEHTVINTVIVLPNGLQLDLRRPVEDLMAQHGATLASQLRSAIENDPLRRMVVFGSQAYPEAAVANFGKNDLRRIKDYLLEIGEPLVDTQLIADVFYHNPRQTDYEAFRFALNYRLSREKDFEFVGIEGAQLWSARGMPAIGTKRVKATEMGNLTGYIEEGFDDSLKDQSVEAIRRDGKLSHVLSFFEWEYGMLPLTRALAALLPVPLLNDQRTATLRFEMPQHYTGALVELRFPTGNRGGWVQGVEAIFHEYLVPGALITVARTEQPHTFALSYEEQPEQTDRVLAVDETKKTPKYIFTNVSYACAVDTEMLVNQQQYGKLRNLKAFPMAERRKGDQMIEHVFEIIGDPIGTRTEPRYRSTEQQLFVGLNALRPASREYLAHLLADGDLFERDDERDGGWLFTPAPKPQSSDDDKEDEEYEDDE